VGRPLRETEDQRRQPLAHRADRALHAAENLVYGLAGAVLVLGALFVLGTILYRLGRDLTDGTLQAVTAALDGLLLVFILLELLAAVRATMTERRLVAEPFLIVGIIASIKEIVVTALDAKEERGEGGAAFADAITEIGVLGAVVLVLAVATLLVRRKEREPAEEAD
jgi:uncharacterized membrane protein (DUF373 family)